MAFIPLAFEEPPPKQSGRQSSGQSAEVAKFLRENPNKWVRVEEFPINRRRNGSFHDWVGRNNVKEQYEVSSRVDKSKGVYSIYARYIGK